MKSRYNTGVVRPGTRAPEAWTHGVTLIAGFTVLHRAIAAVWAVVQQRNEFLLSLALTPILLSVLSLTVAAILWNHGRRT